MPITYALRGATLGWGRAGQRAGARRRANGATLSLRAYRVYEDIPAPPASHHVTKSIVCFRHGDRSASHNLFEPESELAVQEALAWSLELPTKAQEKRLHQLARSSARRIRPASRRGVGVGKLTVRALSRRRSWANGLKAYIVKKTLPAPTKRSSRATRAITPAP